MALNPDDCLLCRHAGFLHHLVTDDLHGCDECKDIHVYTPYVRPDIKWEDVLDKVADFYEAK